MKNKEILVECRDRHEHPAYDETNKRSVYEYYMEQYEDQIKIKHVRRSHASYFSFFSSKGVIQNNFGGDVDHCGGATIVTFYPYGFNVPKTYIGVAVCSNNDPYDKKTGVELAIRNAFRALDADQKVYFPKMFDADRQLLSGVVSAIDPVDLLDAHPIK